MIKADYPNKQALGNALADAASKPREPFELKVEGGDLLPFFIQHTAGNIISGKMAIAPFSLVTIDLDTQEITIT